MALMTMIARVIDGLPLVGTMQDDEQSGRSILEYQNQAKMLFRKLGSHSPARCSIETGPYLFHYLIENDVCYLVMCDKMYSKRLAFNYLEDLAQEFYKNHGRRVNSVTRPYAFIEFDIYIQKARKQLTDRRRNINTINTQLQDVQRIMCCNFRCRILMMCCNGERYYRNLIRKLRTYLLCRRNTKKTQHI
ncbi:vesicle-trafficking protein SEC22b isoform X2 [Hermetia illucens]|uniref:vesicle-trafficking protein SEC22b isoform X2 n=1 Tax=Hermetia illucens TaxID=343691 RepID=UPI0018CC39E6|nr:vesicle-trafficking protein SEC22b isoform X2 [Hermetia illucens]